MHFAASHSAWTMYGDMWIVFSCAFSLRDACAACSCSSKYLIRSWPWELGSALWYSAGWKIRTSSMWIIFYNQIYWDIIVKIHENTKYSQVYGIVHVQVKHRTRPHLQLRGVLALNSCCWALHQVLHSNVPVSHAESGWYQQVRTKQNRARNIKCSFPDGFLGMNLVKVQLLGSTNVKVQAIVNCQTSQSNSRHLRGLVRGERLLQFLSGSAYITPANESWKELEPSLKPWSPSCSFS